MYGVSHGQILVRIEQQDMLGGLWVTCDTFHILLGTMLCLQLL